MSRTLGSRRTVHAGVTGTAFLEGAPVTREALAFADERHAGQTSDSGERPFVTHPVEVACLLHEAGFSDEVVAAGVLHDVIENTDADRAELDRRFGAHVAALVSAVSDDPSIEGYSERKAALRDQVAEAGPEAAAVFAADKVSKARELHRKIERKGVRPRDRAKLRHYEASLDMVAGCLPGHQLVDRLRAELDEFHALGG
jgi:(p)ppGpp synthase/HD superfamily hydrolase